jgi:8-oxo-dGTP diphosphatase
MSYTYEYPRPCVSVDCIVFRKADDRLKVLLIKRLNPPYQNKWALPGGFIDMDETLEQSAARELKEETGLDGIELSQLYAFGDPGRDPRARVITVTFFGFATGDVSGVKASDDAKEAGWFNVDELPELAFDHNNMIEMALNRVE